MDTPAKYEGAAFWAKSHDELCEKLWNAMGDRAVTGTNIADQVVTELRRLWDLERSLSQQATRGD